jgi:hypothetical protein
VHSIRKHQKPGVAWCCMVLHGVAWHGRIARKSCVEVGRREPSRLLVLLVLLVVLVLIVLLVLLVRGQDHIRP